MRPYSSNDSSHFHDSVPTRISQDIVTLCPIVTLCHCLNRPLTSRPKPVSKRGFLFSCKWNSFSRLASFWKWGVLNSEMTFYTEVISLSFLWLIFVVIKNRSKNVMKLTMCCTSLKGTVKQIFYFKCSDQESHHSSCRYTYCTCVAK